MDLRGGFTSSANAQLRHYIKYVCENNWCVLDPDIMNSIVILKQQSQDVSLCFKDEFLIDASWHEIYVSLITN